LPCPTWAYYEINITDNGIGFDEKFLDRIFQVFQRLHGKDDYAGTGIGLAICQKVVENHQGALTATSSPGKGATFSVYLPRLDMDTV
jgi:signal transduction histidine kinase